MESSALLTTDLGALPLLARGKVRDIYAVSPDPASDLLFIASDRLSAFDHVLGSGIPDKGRILTQLSLFWFDFVKDVVPNHLITADVSEFPASLQPFKAQLEGRTMLVKRAQMFPVECVVRGYLSGSGWKDYQATQAICGIPLPAGLRESDKLPEPIFTPAAKINTGGHDENISFATVIETIGAEHANALRELSLAIYAKASAHAATRGVILADTKFEFGLIDGQITLADEVLTPDSSRYWPASQYAPGGPTPSFDKQYVRDYLESIHWNKQAPAPSLPPEVVTNTREKYLQAFHLISGRDTL
ncbi:phosphoribosylaminoimidazolesuccinocarboxamide synthase [Granulicella tundricola]|uniref:Phosphoribosylaminoimidazole-succinocarboxamide synthase n=1 Tax=Granulicella tundricola (strain ATCC BAA-1859 / DSM 23138 / MP5ACTX9) TaxID=1198114 RepID=E8X5B6_GRATM|nr:phosphoribosylaminoimidazolesuccinocarboxamide synthase [Granulicella tundricola]ADW69463.1 phosphoribosylaminoimidazole-succinocarboxamide synthase [Granulicella tundricola MP5ACTX9]